ncbi:hypothetical protein FOC1_g10012359 [Fusarium oxysporum f. sp. cubense race 1]|uniref:Uncharacterized protein n=1 Tax=Fusarium oxysporum f. sp. cubense (strain race 1) TaxID=1229664 RepID=N4UNP2_FUSC1|nr:hypothetical protein FOC1_g10012359 [Fusarium oxysporum f. sp. cubense race 1]
MWPLAETWLNAGWLCIMLILQGTMPQMHPQGSKSGVTVPKLPSRNNLVDAKVAKARPTFGPNVRLILLEQASIASVSHKRTTRKGVKREDHTIPNMQVFHADETCRGVVALLWYDPSLDPLMQVRVQFRKSVSY